MNPPLELIGTTDERRSLIDHLARTDDMTSDFEVAGKRNRVSGLSTNVIDTEREQGFKLTYHSGCNLQVQVQCNFIQHELASLHFSFLQFYFFTIPQAFLTMLTSALAFFSGSESATEDKKHTISLIIGITAALVVFLQTLSEVLTYGKRAEMHKNVAIDLRDLRKYLQFLNEKLGSMVRRQNRSDNDNNYFKNNSLEKENEIARGIDETFDSIQTRFGQSLTGCKSNVPPRLSSSFQSLNSTIMLAQTKEVADSLYTKYGSLSYGQMYYSKAYDILEGQILNYILFPFRFPDPIELKDETVRLLQIELSENSIFSSNDNDSQSNKDKKRCTNKVIAVAILTVVIIVIIIIIAIYVGNEKLKIGIMTTTKDEDNE
mmetsp:Transcript_48397/g.54854  ORF Transcript_48397/g.54854 Transcript_48397/m.54854 type:complete len:375 (+) Transcript_48397:61-1185(+)